MILTALDLLFVGLCSSGLFSIATVGKAGSTISIYRETFGIRVERLIRLDALVQCDSIKVLKTMLSDSDAIIHALRLHTYLLTNVCDAGRREENGASLAAKRYEQQQRHQQQLQQQQVPLRQLDECSCYATAAKMMPMTTTTTYDCPCVAPGDCTTDNVARIPPPPPPLLLPVGGSRTTTCDVCGRAMSAESRCRCAAVWESPYSRLPVGDTGSHVTYMATTTAAGSGRRVASPRPSDLMTSSDAVRHVTMTSALGDGLNCSRAEEETSSGLEAGRSQSVTTT